VFEHLAEIAAINPPAAGRAPNEMLGLIRGRLSDAAPPLECWDIT
jgi:hypothetical protein